MKSEHIFRLLGLFTLMLIISLLMASYAGDALINDYFHQDAPSVISGLWVAIMGTASVVLIGLFYNILRKKAMMLLIVAAVLLLNFAGIFGSLKLNLGFWAMLPVLVTGGLAASWFFSSLISGNKRDMVGLLPAMFFIAPAFIFLKSFGFLNHQPENLHYQCEVSNMEMDSRVLIYKEDYTSFYRYAISLQCSRPGENNWTWSYGMILPRFQSICEEGRLFSINDEWMGLYVDETLIIVSNAEGEFSIYDMDPGLNVAQLKADLNELHSQGYGYYEIGGLANDRQIKTYCSTDRITLTCTSGSDEFGQLEFFMKAEERVLLEEMLHELIVFSDYDLSGVCTFNYPRHPESSYAGDGVRHIRNYMEDVLESEAAFDVQWEYDAFHDENFKGSAEEEFKVNIEFVTYHTGMITEMEQKENLSDCEN